MRTAFTSLAWLLVAIPPLGSPASAQPTPINNVLPLLEQDKPIFGQFVNYIGVGPQKRSSARALSNAGFRK